MKNRIIIIFVIVCLLLSASINHIGLYRITLKPNFDTTVYHNVTATCYRANVNECDSSPLLTADGSYIDTNRVDELRWIAISRDLNKVYKMGEKVYVSGIGNGYDGIWTVHDRMNKRFKKKIDFLISKAKMGGLFKNVKISKI
jgi:3D (Asp-Asp-Asp) domain-containing protein